MAEKKKAGSGNAGLKDSAKSTTDPEPFEVKPGWFKTTEIVASLDVSDTAFKKWKVEPVAREHQYGAAYYRLADILANRLENQAQRFERPEQDMQAAELREEKERADIQLKREQAEGQRLKNAQMRRELAPVEMVQWAISQAGSQMAAVLGTIKGKVKRAQPDLTNAALHELEQIVVEAQNIAADTRLEWDDFDTSDVTDPRSD